MSKKRVIQTPAKYFQGPNLIDDLGSLVKPFGKRFLILTEGFIFDKKKEEINKSFCKEGLEFTPSLFNGECTKNEIDRVTVVAQQAGAEAVIGFGGGKVLDTAKYVAYKCGVPCISVPSISSTDAPCTSVVVIYTETGEVEISTNVPESPRLIVVDSQLISEAPIRLFVSGMGDALSTYFEARTSKELKFENILGGEITESAMALAKVCFDILMADGYQAKIDIDNKKLTDTVERVIEADTYLSGIGFESGGLSAAHGIHNALKNLQETHKVMHGELVAFGTLCLIDIENREEDDFNKIIEFCEKVGLPTTLKQVGIVEDVEEKVKQVAHDSMRQAPKYHMPLNATEQVVFDSIMNVDKIGRSRMGL